jgi:uracil-DNA glycosylase
MHTPSTDLPYAEAALMLAWLVEMGADEILTEAPQNRFEEKVVTPPPSAKPQLRPPPKLKEPSRPGVSAVNPEDATRLATQCGTLTELYTTMEALDLAGLRKTAMQFCFFEAAPEARTLVLGDRPHTEEEQFGGVFAGRTAILLRNMLKAISLAFPDDAGGEAVSLANLVPWRPAGNQTPSDHMVALCAPFSRRMIELMKPRAILALGALPGKTLAGAGASVAQQRGKWHKLTVGDLEIPLLATFHPFELLSYPERKRQAWEDLQKFRERRDAP